MSNNIFSGWDITYPQFEKAVSKPEPPKPQQPAEPGGEPPGAEAEVQSFTLEELVGRREMTFRCFSCYQRLPKSKLIFNDRTGRAICLERCWPKVPCECGKPASNKSWMEGSDNFYCQECAPPEKLEVVHLNNPTTTRNILGERKKLWDSISEQTPNPSSSIQSEDK